VTTPVKKSQETRYNFNTVSCFVNRFWGRRPDGVAISQALQIGYTSERALRTAAPKWEFEQIDFVVGNCGSVVESNFYTKLQKLDVHQ